MTRRITYCISALFILLVTTWLAIGCNITIGEAPSFGKPSPLLTVIALRNHNVDVEIAKDDSIRVNKVIIDGNEIFPAQFTESKANNTWVAKVPVTKTPHIEAWIKSNTQKAKEAYEKAKYDYSVWAYDMMKQGRVFDPRITTKQAEWEERLAKAKRELDKWDAINNGVYGSLNLKKELGKYITIETANAK